MIGAVENFAVPLMTLTDFSIWCDLNLEVDFMIWAVLMIWGRFYDLGHFDDLVC